MESIQQIFKGHIAAVALTVSASLPYAGSAIAQDFESARLQNVSHSQNVQPSQLIEDNGVLWFKKGTDGKTKYSVARSLSTETELSIVASSSPDPNDGVANLGRQVKGWLESHPDIDEVSLIAAEDLKQGAGFVFYIDGVAFSPSRDHDGVLPINEVSAQLPEIVKLYREVQEYKTASQQPSPQ